MENWMIDWLVLDINLVIIFFCNYIDYIILRAVQIAISSDVLG